MTTKKKPSTKTKEAIKEVPKELTIRQFFYNEKKYDEPVIKSLERTYKEESKTIEEWVEILSFKGITF